MNLRRHFLEAATIVGVSILVALVSNSLASRERKLKLPGDYPNATTVPAAAGEPSAPSQAALHESSPAKAQQATGGLSSKREFPSPQAMPAPQGTAGASSGPPPSKKIPGDAVSPASPPAAPSDLLSRFPPHPDKPWVEISGEDAVRLRAAGVPFLDARRTSVYEEGHVAGARPVSVWESDVDEKVMALIGELDPAKALVLYCSGGDCEDSHLLAQKLWGAGFNDLLVYRDGYPDWVRRGGPVRTGAAP